MTTTTNRVLTALLLATMLGMIGLAGTHRGAVQGAQSVLVTNAASAAVPVKNGSTPFNVTVANTIGQPVPVKQNGNWYVGLSGVPNIHVANTAGSPVFSSITNGSSNPVPVKGVDDPGRTPFEMAISMDIAVSSSSASEAIPPVPAGQRLVITHISASSSCTSPSQPAGYVFINDLTNSANVYHFDILAYPPGENEGTVGSQDCFIVLNPGDAASIAAERPYSSDLTYYAPVNGAIEGYYISNP